MGHRLEIYTNKNIAHKIIDIASSFKIDAQIIGRVEKANKRSLTIKSMEGIFVY